jgi:hypothetical protein
MSFAVATTNTGTTLSCVQVRIVPNTRCDVPPSLPSEPCVSESVDQC